MSNSLVLPEDWAMVVGKKGEISLPFESRIFLLGCEVVGSFAQEHLEELQKDLRKGDALVLRRESENRHDDRAVAIYRKDFQLGYMPRRKNLIPSRLMDGGKLLTAHLHGFSGEWPNLEMIMKVYLEDL